MIRLDQYDNSGFDRGAGKLKEIAWNLTKLLFFLPPWPIPSSLRCALLRLFGAKIGEGVVIRSRTNITFPWRLEIGDHCWIGEEVIILSLAGVAIGDHCCLSQRAFICTGSHDFNKPTFDLIAKPITIGESSWIAASAFVGPGVDLQAGTLVKANQVVSA
jgi:putative colanic acid biosynthesis acetyltransferase WcaF